MGTMDFCLIPTGAFHDPFGTNGTDCCMWCVVAPNWRGHRLQTTDFGPAELDPVPVVARVDGPGALPSNELLESTCVELAPGESEEHLVWRAGSERLIYVLAGEAEITIDRLSGVVEPHGFVLVPSGARHSVRNVGPDTVRFVSVFALDPPGIGLLAPLPAFE
jgi:mannose-6-phosphate isomerase-like protein (cupin superfamily)